MLCTTHGTEWITDLMPAYMLQNLATDQVKQEGTPGIKTESTQWAQALSMKNTEKWKKMN